jgi:5,10-methylenetetrahydromethanopterin reductase
MGHVRPAQIGERARQAEEDGWTGLKLFDTQCLFGDVFVMMTAAAMSTERLRLSISASNPATRHPAVAASSIAAVAEIAGDRVWYGIGRGDSALAHVGGAPAPVDVFERYIAAVRQYLHGEPVSFESIREWRVTDDVSTIQLGHAPADSRIAWRGETPTPVPIEVYASGPRVLGVAGRRADRVSLGLGADPVRIRWAIETARAARSEAGLDPSTLSFAAVIPVGVADDMTRARQSVANMVASSARFSVMSGRVVGPVDDGQRRVYEAIGESYDMTRHGGHGSQVAALTDEFTDTFAIVGPPARCVERIAELAEIGIDAFMLAPPQGDAGDDDIRDGYRRLVDDVLPVVLDTVSVR